MRVKDIKEDTIEEMVGDLECALKDLLNNDENQDDYERAIDLINSFHHVANILRSDLLD